MMDQLIYQVSKRFDGRFNVWAKRINAHAWKILAVFDDKDAAKQWVEQAKRA